MSFERRQFIPDPSDKIDVKVSNSEELSKLLEEEEGKPEILMRDLNKLILKLWECSDREIKDLLGAIEDRIRQEIGDLGNFAQFEEAQNLINTPTSKFFQIFNMLREKIGTRNLGNYNDIENKIRISHELKSILNPREIIAEIAKSGFSTGVATLHHEVIHSKQADPTLESDRLNYAELQFMRIITKFRLELLLVFLNSVIPNISIPIAMTIGLLHFLRVRRSKDETILREGQAYIGESRYTLQYSGLDKLTEYLQGSYSISKNKLDQVVAMVHDIKRLYALGLPDETVAQLVRSSKWDRKMRAFDDLENAVTALTEASGIKEEQIDDLVITDDIRTKIYLEKVKRIAQEEMEKFFKDKEASNDDTIDYAKK